MKKRKKYYNSPVFFLILILGLILIVKFANEAIARRGFESQMIALGEQSTTSQGSYVMPTYETAPNIRTIPNSLIAPRQNGILDQTYAINRVLNDRPLEAEPREVAMDVPPAKNPEQPAAQNNALIEALCKTFPFLWVCLPEQPQPVVVQPALPFQALPKPLVIVPPLGVAPAAVAQQPVAQNPAPQPCNIIKKYCEGDFLKWDYYKLSNNQPPEEILCATPKAVGNCDADHSGRRTCKMTTSNGATTAKCADR